ncbi:hypothetical protein ITP53_37350 [Nonomuraea sp. K274]|uniref:Uncharacterized protein n=1 Tax=Nonomuraea cypriaca TaxID=1187855 RepID=A0A931F347_9ACTN|nr:hypothetical protein [Nonomuraea cypriaca]MBF8191272.1 hypothetical protein [Nonomuraea cypriaca]
MNAKEFAMFMPRSLIRLTVGAVAGYLFAVRPWHLRWGADDREVHGDMAGDDIVRVPQYQATRAVTVDAPPAAVWPWLVQLGGYTPGAAAPRPATSWVGPTDDPGTTPRDTAAWPGATEAGGSGAASAESQGLKAGDVLNPSPDGTGFVVEQVDPPHTLVLAMRGEDAAVSSSISLREVDGGTRLVCRVRIRAQPGLRGTTYLATMDVGDFLSMRRQLLTIKSRAESSR